MLKVRRLLTALSLTVMMPLALAACGDSPTVEFSPPPTATAAPIQKLEVPLEQPHYGFTYQRPDGNRYVEGQGNLPDAQVLDIELSGTPQWLVAASAGSGSIWVAVFQDGQTQAFRVECEKAVEIGVAPSILPPGAPPLLAVAGGEAFLIAPPSDAASPLTHPVPLGNSGRLAFIETDGDLVVWQDGAESGRSAVDALPDARLMVDEDATDQAVRPLSPWHRRRLFGGHGDHAGGNPAVAAGRANNRHTWQRGRGRNFSHLGRSEWRWPARDHSHGQRLATGGGDSGLCRSG